MRREDEFVAPSSEEPKEVILPDGVTGITGTISLGELVSSGTLEPAIAPELIGDAAMSEASEALIRTVPLTGTVFAEAAPAAVVVPVREDFEDVSAITGTDESSALPSREAETIVESDKANNVEVLIFVDNLKNKILKGIYISTGINDTNHYDDLYLLKEIDYIAKRALNANRFL